MGKQSTTDSSSSLASLIASETGRQQSLLDMIAKNPPTYLNFNLNDLNDLVEEQSLLNAYKSKAAERELSPEVAATRDATDREIADTFQKAMAGELPEGVQNALIKAGLQSSLAVGGRRGNNTLGSGSAERVFGLNANDYLNDVRNRTLQWLQTKEKPVVGIDPSSAANLRIGEKESNVNAENLFKQNLVNSTLASDANRSNLATSSLMAAIQEAQSNNASKNYARNQALGIGTNLLGSAIQGAGLFFGGPAGGAGSKVATKLFGIT